ncbi:hypothetical protein LSAT2_012586 [Lamellibrachia satsuma]|nr:hypothetical protein LSAT2_012586 [Lamellibrachia satsuma]
MANQVASKVLEGNKGTLANAVDGKQDPFTRVEGEVVRIVAPHSESNTVRASIYCSPDGDNFWLSINNMAAKAVQRDAYIGEKRRQVRDGFGVYTYENKFFRYEGEWKDGKKQGHGKLVMADGSYYEGEFDNGEIKGHGFRYNAFNGNTFSGEFSDGEFHGQGVMNYGDGSVYEGDWCRNKRQGYGVFRKNDGTIYQGYLHAHKRHGEGTQVYLDRSRYVGEWVLDKRQGHGEMTFSDETEYIGQWMNDMFNGQGTMQHCSGMRYEGLWVNGKPVNIATKLVIKCENSPVEVIQGETFNIEVECRNDDDEVVEENGRKLQVSAGFQHFVASQSVGSKSKASSRESTQLFDVIEDVDEVPVDTPFGYRMVSYPLTDQAPSVIDTEDMTASLTSADGGEDASQGTHTDEEEGEKRDGEDGQKEEHEEEKDKAQEESVEKADPEGETTVHPSQQDSKETTGTSVDNEALQEQESAVSLPPPVEAVRTEKGVALFPDLLLPTAPPMYRPFIVMEQQKKSKLKSDSHKEIESNKTTTSTPSSKSKKQKSVRGEETAAKTATSIGSPDKNMSVIKLACATSTGEDAISFIRGFAWPGEYVIMVQDVTSPPFMDVCLEPGFLLVKVLPPAPVKKAKKVIIKKDRGPSATPSLEMSEN